MLKAEPVLKDDRARQVNLSALAGRYAAEAEAFVAAHAAPAAPPFLLYVPFSHIHHMRAPGAASAPAPSPPSPSSFAYPPPQIGSSATTAD